jgi:hypothetical protein
VKWTACVPVVKVKAGVSRVMLHPFRCCAGGTQVVCDGITISRCGVNHLDALAAHQAPPATVAELCAVTVLGSAHMDLRHSEVKSCR